MEQMLSASATVDNYAYELVLYGVEQVRGLMVKVQLQGKRGAGADTTRRRFNSIETFRE